VRTLRFGENNRGRHKSSLKTEMTSSPSTNLPPWTTWLAQDADGTWWAYEHEPNEADHAWYENEVGRSERLGQNEPNPEWRKTLQRVGGAD
jgi:hypothetical protein